MLELVYGDMEPLIYEQDMYRGREEDEWLVKAIINYKDIDDTTWYEV